MPAFEVHVIMPLRDPETGDVVDGQHVDDVMLVERPTRAEAEQAAIEAFGPGCKVAKGDTTEVPVVAHPDSSAEPTE